MDSFFKIKPYRGLEDGNGLISFLYRRLQLLKPRNFNLSRRHLISFHPRTTLSQNRTLFLVHNNSRWPWIDIRFSSIKSLHYNMIYRRVNEIIKIISIKNNIICFFNEDVKKKIENGIYNTTRQLERKMRWWACLP